MLMYESSEIWLATEKDVLSGFLSRDSAGLILTNKVAVFVRLHPCLFHRLLEHLYMRLAEELVRSIVTISTEIIKVSSLTRGRERT